MGKTNIIQLYQADNVGLKHQMPVKPEKISSQPETLNISELKLLSINKASKILGIRYASVQKLVRTGRIKSVVINNKYKIPYKALDEFVNEGTASKVNHSTITVEETQNRIDNLLKEYAG